MSILPIEILPTRKAVCPIDIGNSLRFAPRRTNVKLIINILMPYAEIIINNLGAFFFLIGLYAINSTKSEIHAPNRRAKSTPPTGGKPNLEIAKYPANADVIKVCKIENAVNKGVTHCKQSIDATNGQTCYKLLNQLVHSSSPFQRC